jgi:Flp pilus assembly protein TadB
MSPALSLMLAAVASAGVFLVVVAVTAAPTVRLKSQRARGLDLLQARLEAAELPVSAQEFLSICATLAVVGAGLAVVLRTPALALAGAFVAPALVWQRYEGRRDRFRQEYDESLAEEVQLLREGFSATGALRDALDHAARNGPEPAAADFREVWAAQATGADLEEAFAPIVERRRNPYLRMVAEALSLKATEGGDVGQVLLGLEMMTREHTALKREVLARQSQARLESTIVSLAPLTFFLAMKLMPWMREYEADFYSTALGQIALLVAIIFSMLAFLLARRLAVRGLTLEVQEASA